MSIGGDVEKALNEQIAMEFEASHLYLAMSAWFERQDLPGFAHWMRLQSDEEREHAIRIYQHVIDRGGRVRLEAVAAPPDGFGGPRQAVERVAAHERKVTESIHRIYELAGEQRDYAAQRMLHWFIDEQVEEEKMAADLLARLDLVDAGKGSLLMVDKELAKRGDG